MATLDYISIPSCASRLQIQSPPSSQPDANENDIRPAPRLRTALPRPSPESSEGPGSPLKGFASGSALNLLPNLLLGSIPASDAASLNSENSKSNPGRKRFKKLHQEPIVLLSNKDPLSIPITSVNFKRFIERVGPVFWLQDRIEEIIFWRRGWKVTGTWLGAYGFLCYFPRLVFVLPHIILIAIILASVQYPQYKPPPPSVNFSESTSAEPSTDTTPPAAETPLPAPIVEDAVDWQANIQAIQNLMGFYADLHIVVTPYLAHLSLSPNRPKSPFTLPLLTLLIVTLPLSITLVNSTTLFPAQLMCFICGAGPVLFLNPQLRSYSQKSIHPITTYSLPSSIRLCLSRFLNHSLPSQFDSYSLSVLRKRFKMRFQRFLDDNNLSDDVWNSEMREVELWENERLDPGMSSVSLVGSPPGTVSALPPPPSYSKNPKDDTSGSSVTQPTPPPLQQHQRSRSTFFGTTLPPPNGGWSKSHLKVNDRAPWTRGRDGWSGVATGTGGDGDGTVSSNLTFSLAPNWDFVSTEDWRADLVGAWTSEGSLRDDDRNKEDEVKRSTITRPGLGADENGWVYTNDVWLVPADHVYPGAVTRRRRWVRRIWYNTNSGSGSES